MGLTMGLNGLPMDRHGASACLVAPDGQVLSFVQEERLTGVKWALDSAPTLAARWCLESVGATPDDVSAYALGWNWPRSKSVEYHRPDLVALSDADLIRFMTGWAPKASAEICYFDHHLAHAATSFYWCGAAAAAVLVSDGSGEHFQAIKIFDATEQGGITELESWPVSHSIGAMFGAASKAIGFSWLEAGKTMGLSAYGDSAADPLPVWAATPEWSPVVGHRGMTTAEVSKAWFEYFSRLGSEITEPPKRLHQDAAAVTVARSAQDAVEQAMQFLTARARQLTGKELVCLSGGVALNCSANGQLPTPVFCPPVPDDPGVSIGAAWLVTPPTSASLTPTPYLGPCIPGIPVERAKEVAERLLNGQVGAIAAGAMESGPRALGNRSVVAIPRDREVLDRVNGVKGREPWRPLAPIAMPHVAKTLWSPIAPLDTFMAGAVVTSKLCAIVAPAVVHVDGTTRPQVIATDQFAGHRTSGVECLAEVLREIESRGEIGVLINTSLNSAGRPIAADGSQAHAEFSRMPLDFMLVGDELCSR